MGRLIGHTGCQPGKRVLVRLKSGERFIDRFKERTDRYVFLEQHGRIAKTDIESFTIYKKKE